MKFTTFSVRSLQRNYRRSLVTILSIAFGYSAITLFAGYTKVVYRGLADQAVYGEMLGHVTISRKGMATEGRLDPEKYLFNRDEIEKINAIVHASIPETFIAPRLRLSGLLSNGRASTVFIAEAIAPHDMEILRGPRSGMTGGLDKKPPSAVTLATGLADMLNLKEGDGAAVLVSNIHGQANALDVVIADVFNTGNAGTEDKYIYMPLAFAQSLYDADQRADRLTVLTRTSVPSTVVRETLVKELKQSGFDVDIKTWQELSSFYRQVKMMLDMIFGFLLAIVLTIVVMSITNALSMSVVERTREIGTLRAIGMRRIGIIRIFVTEALLLVLLGCVLGLILSIVLRLGINAADISYQPPNATGKVPLLIDMDFTKSGITAFMLVMLGVVSASFPAWRAARRPVIDSLGHA